MKCREVQWIQPPPWPQHRSGHLISHQAGQQASRGRPALCKPKTPASHYLICSGEAKWSSAGGCVPSSQQDLIAIVLLWDPLSLDKEWEGSQQNSNHSLTGSSLIDQTSVRHSFQIKIAEPMNREPSVPEGIYMKSKSKSHLYGFFFNTLNQCFLLQNLKDV